MKEWADRSKDEKRHDPDPERMGSHADFLFCLKCKTAQKIKEQNGHFPPYI
jgi:hypothetical protein